MHKFARAFGFVFGVISILWGIGGGITLLALQSDGFQWTAFLAFIALIFAGIYVIALTSWICDLEYRMDKNGIPKVDKRDSEDTDDGSYDQDFETNDPIDNEESINKRG